MTYIKGTNHSEVLLESPLRMEDSTEREPLLPNPNHSPTLSRPLEQPVTKRTNFLDNLRATLIVLLIAHHATQEVFQNHTEIPRLQVVILSLFSATNKSCLWTTFFVVSGYSSALALQKHSATRSVIDVAGSLGGEETDDGAVQDQHPTQQIQDHPRTQRHPDLKYLLRYTLRTLLPAILYDAIGHFILFIFLSMNWERIFGSFKANWAYMRLSGPVAYVYLLSVLVYGHVGMRFVKRWWMERGRGDVQPPDLEFTPASFAHNDDADVTRNTEPTTPKYIISLLVLSMIILIVFTYFSCVYNSLIPQSWLYIFVVIQYDFITPDAPVSYILGYILGVHLPSILAWIPHHPRLPLFTRIPRLTWISLTSALITSWASMGVAQHFSPSLYDHIRIQRYFDHHLIFVNGGFNAHTMFFVIWHAFNTFFIPFFTVLAFSSSEFTQRKWDFGFKPLRDSLARHTAIIPYIHMIPILIGLYVFDPIILNCVTVTLLAILGSWVFTIPANTLNFRGR